MDWKSIVNNNVLENEAIYILREVAAQLKNVLFFGMVRIPYLPW